MPKSKKIRIKGRRFKGKCPTRADLFDLLSNDLPPEEALLIRGHLGECTYCAGVLEEEKQFKSDMDKMVAVLKASDESALCPDVLLLCKYWEGTVTKLQHGLVTLHLKYCRRCRDFVALLRDVTKESGCFPPHPRKGWPPPSPFLPGSSPRGRTKRIRKRKSI